VSGDAVLRVSGLVKGYRLGESRLDVLRGLALSVPGGQMCAVMGPSGVGKSTLLNCIAGLEPPDEGEVSVLCASLHPAARAVRADAAESIHYE
jgi:putative ABC transport system ATP-binding protein